LVRVVIVAGPDLQLSFIRHGSAREVDTFVGPAPSEATGQSVNPLLVGAT
jgi:hypothetical protein